MSDASSTLFKTEKLNRGVQGIVFMSTKAKIHDESRWRILKTRFFVTRFPASLCVLSSFISSRLVAKKDIYLMVLISAEKKPSFVSL